MMEDKKPLSWKGLVATAKTLRERFKEVQGYPLDYNVIFIRRDGKTCDDEKLDEELVPLGDVLEVQEQLRKLLDGFGSIDDYDNDDVIELIKGLREVLDSGKEGDKK